MWHFSDNREHPRNSKEARSREAAGLAQAAGQEREAAVEIDSGVSGGEAAEADASVLVSDEARVRSSEFHQML
ncbi:MAG: hypothetical protein J7639_06230 [Paenibacillaceae bacterium]|nr:hypothetical protein [Paenibacillaceae bacterium]